MAVQKTTHFSSKQRITAIIAKSVSHPARISILEYLNSVEYASNQELAALTELSEPTVHQHLKVLRESGMITGFFRGKFHYYRLHPSANDRLKKLLVILEDTDL